MARHKPTVPFLCVQTNSPTIVADAFFSVQLRGVEIRLRAQNDPFSRAPRVALFCATTKCDLCYDYQDPSPHVLQELFLSCRLRLSCVSVYDGDDFSAPAAMASHACERLERNRVSRYCENWAQADYG